MNIFNIGFIVIILAYSLLILSYAYFFAKLKRNSLDYQIVNPIKVSIIIAARNEAHCILTLMKSIKNQNYTPDSIEIIVVDDASTDDTFKTVEKFADQYPDFNCKLIRIEEDSIKPTYKKFAISKAILQSEGELIITTDADCIVGPYWVSGIVNYYQQTKAKILVGLVAYQHDTSVFQKMQHLEFLSLIASGAAAVQSGFPIMCNGANLIYERKAFDEVNGFDSNAEYASGDDVFLLLKIKKHYGKESVFALNDRKTIVYTEAKKTFPEFLHQRIRWASKTKGYKDVAILMVAGIIFLFNACILFTFLMGIFQHELLKLSLILFIIKLIVDFPILFGITAFVNRKDLLLYFIPLQIIYLPYVLIIGTISNFVSYQWKGRKIDK
ncbi:MAG: glycosyltransferase [Bacteroidales bacterium]